MTLTNPSRPQARPPVLLVAGFSQPARHAVVQAFLRHRGGGSPAGDIAWLDNQDEPAQAGEFHPAASFMACACCAGTVVFETWLARILRRQAWAGVVITLAARAEPLKLKTLLSGASWGDVLGPVRLASVIGEPGLSVLAQPDHALHEVARQQKELARWTLKPGEALPADLFSSF